MISHELKQPRDVPNMYVCPAVELTRLGQCFRGCATPLDELTDVPDEHQRRLDSVFDAKAFGDRRYVREESVKEEKRAIFLAGARATQLSLGAEGIG
jgi:hypothetical protein